MNFKEAVQYLTECGLEAELANSETSVLGGDEVIHGTVPHKRGFFGISRKDSDFFFHEATDAMIGFKVQTSTLVDVCQIACGIYLSPPIFDQQFIFSQEYRELFDKNGLQVVLFQKWTDSISFLVGDKDTDIIDIVTNQHHSESSEERKAAHEQMKNIYRITSLGLFALVNCYVTTRNSGIVFISKDLGKIAVALCDYHMSKDKLFRYVKYL